MNIIEVPANLEETKALLPLFAIAVLLSMPILLWRNWWYSGVIPGSTRQWARAAQRMLAIVAVVFSLLSNAPVAGICAIIAALLLVTSRGRSAQDDGGFARSIGWISLSILLLKSLLFPVVN